VALKGAYDVGRMYELTVRRVLDRDVLRVPEAMKLDQLAAEFARSRRSIAFVHKEDDTFVGIVEAQTANARIAELGKESEATAGILAQPQAHLLTPADRLSTALEVLDEMEQESAAVVMSPTDPRLVGCVHESDLLRCYIEEADRMRRDELGAEGLFAEGGSPG